jgi:hypothetical protein
VNGIDGRRKPAAHDPDVLLLVIGHHQCHGGGREDGQAQTQRWAFEQ